MWSIDVSSSVAFFSLVKAIEASPLPASQSISPAFSTTKQAFPMFLLIRIVLSSTDAPGIGS